MRTVLYNCGPIVTFDSDEPLVGQQMVNDEWISPVGKAIVVNNNLIEEIVDSIDALDDYQSHQTDEVNLVDVSGKAIIPGPN